MNDSTAWFLSIIGIITSLVFLYKKKNEVKSGGSIWASGYAREIAALIACIIAFLIFSLMLLTGNGP
jgi:hypothetical protein